MKFIIFCISLQIASIFALFGGEEAKAHSARYIVAIHHDSSMDIRCGGVILQKNIILTAAHCANTNLTITAGAHNIKLNESTQQKRTATDIIIHMKFINTGFIEPYDIALIYLDSNLEYNAYVQPIDLPELDKCFHGNVTAYGWGATSHPDQYPDVLQKLEMPIMKRNSCRRTLLLFGLPNIEPVHVTHICTGPINVGKSIYEGDHGGPIVQTNADGEEYLVGIISYTADQYGSGPSVHNNIALLRDFIDENIDNKMFY